MEEYFFQCPYCWEQISMLLEPSSCLQQYIEDCEVCCNPIDFNITVNNNEIIFFSADVIDQ